jgi:hypothetical protein
MRLIAAVSIDRSVRVFSLMQRLCLTIAEPRGFVKVPCRTQQTARRGGAPRSLKSSAKSADDPCARDLGYRVEDLRRRTLIEDPFACAELVATSRAIRLDAADVCAMIRYLRHQRSSRRRGMSQPELQHLRPCLRAVREHQLTDGHGVLQAGATVTKRSPQSGRGDRG